jgi:hypothetical protein
MSFVLDRTRISASKAAQLLLAALIALVVAAPASVFAQAGSEVVQNGSEGRDFRSVRSGRWIDAQTWQVFRSGVWINGGVGAGIPDANRNVFIETNHTIIATRAQVQNSGSVIDYNGNQASAYIEVNNLHINTAASITTTWGSVIGGFTASDWYDGDRFGGYVNPNEAIAGSVVNPTSSITVSQYNGEIGAAAPVNQTPDDFDRVWWESIPTGAGAGTAAAYLGVGSINSQLFRPFSNPSGATTITAAATAAGAQGLDPSTGGALTRPRNNELRVYGKLRYYAGAALDRSDRDAGIQVTSATIGTGSTIVFRGTTRVITTREEWSTTLATVTGYSGANYGGAINSTGDNSQFMINAAGITAGAVAYNRLNPDGTVTAIPSTSRDNPNNERFRSLMGRNSFWTAIFDLGRVRDRSSSRELYANVNDYPDGAIGTLEGNFTAGIIQVRRGTLRVDAAVLLANEGAVTSGSIQIMNNAVLQIAGPTGIGRTAVPAQPSTLNAFAGTFTSYDMRIPLDGVASWGYNALAAGGGFAFPAAVNANAPNYSAQMVNLASSPLPNTPRGPYAVTSRMRYFVVEEGGALDFQNAVGIEASTNLPAGINPPLSPTNNNFSFGANLSAADVRFNGTVIYSRTGDQNFVSDSPFLSFNPTGVTVGAGATAGLFGQPRINNGVLAMGENGLFDPYNNLRDIYNVGAISIGAGPTAAAIAALQAPPASFGVGAAGLFAPATTAAYSHLTIRGSGYKFLLATTVTISRSLLIQGNARLSLNQFVNPLATNVVSPHLGFSVAAGRTNANTIGSAASGYPPLVFLRSTGLTGFLEENNIGTTSRAASRNLPGAVPVIGGIANNSNVGVLGGTANFVFEGQVQPMWSAYGGNTDPVAFVGFTTASTSIVPLDNDLSYPIGMVLSASTNREQIDMSPWHKPFVVHGLPAEPTYVTTTGAQGANTHGWSFRGQQYDPQTLAIARFGQVIRQSLDRINGFTVAATDYTLVTPDPQAATGGANQYVNLGVGITAANDNLRAHGHNQIDAAATSYIGAAGNYPMITNSLYDYAINTTATTTLQYDSELSDVMTQVELPLGPVGAHNLVMNSPSNVTQILPIRTNTGLKLGVNPTTAYVFGVTGGTIILGPEHTNTPNGYLPRQAFNPTYSGDVPYYQSNARYPECQSPMAASDLAITNPMLVTAGVLASAYIDTRPDVIDPATRFAAGGQFSQQTDLYSVPKGLRPSNLLTGTFDGRVRIGWPRFFTQTAMIVPTGFAGAGSIATFLPYVAQNQIALPNTVLAHGVQQFGANTRRIPTNGPSDFGRRGDFNNFGTLELRRGTLELPSNNIEETAVFNGAGVATAAGFPDGRTPVGGLDARRTSYTLTLSSTAIISADQQNVTYFGQRVGASNTQKIAVVLSDNPNGGDRGTPNTRGFMAVGGTPTALAGGAVVRGPAGPANLAGILKGGSLVNIIVTGGNGREISNAAVNTARSTPINGGNNVAPTNGGSTPQYGYEPPTYAATDVNGNGGNTELNALSSGVVGVTAVVAPAGSTSTVYNPGPEKYTDIDFSQLREGGNGAISNLGSANITGRDENVFGNGRVYGPTGLTDVNQISGHSGVNFLSLNGAGANAFGQAVRNTNAYNLDLPYVVGGVQHFTMIRGTSNVVTLVGNRDNLSNGPDAVTANATANAGLQVYGTIATARGDIDLNGRNIELGGNNSRLVETFEKTQVVDSITGQILWNPNSIGLSRDFSNGTITPRTSTTVAAWNNQFSYGRATGSVFPTLPSTVRNENRSVRAYIGLTSPRNIVYQNSPGGATQVSEALAGLGAFIYYTANPAQLRVRRWQTRGNGLQGNISPRRGAGNDITGIDRYWQVETTGTQQDIPVRSEIRLQYVDTDLNNDNGCFNGIAPAALNVFRNAGQPNQGVLNFPNGGFDGQGGLQRNWQALQARNNIGLDNYNFHKQLTVMGATQDLGAGPVLTTSNFTQLASPLNNDPTNPTPADVNGVYTNSGFQMWAIGVTAPKCYIVRGQRYGGGFGDAIGGSGVALAAPFATGSAVSQATAALYGPYVGPFKADIATAATVIVDILDDFNNTANYATGYSARLQFTETNRDYYQPVMIAGGTVQTTGTNGRGGRLEFPGVRLGGISSTSIVMSVVATDRNGAVLAAGASTALPMCNVAVPISLQGGAPFRVDFAQEQATTGAGLLSKAPGVVTAPNGVTLPGAPTATPCVQVGTPINFGGTFGAGSNDITVTVRDRFNNLASFPTSQVRLTLNTPNTTSAINTDRASSVVGRDQLGFSWGLGSGVGTFGRPGYVAPGNQVSSGLPADANYSATVYPSIPAVFAQLGLTGTALTARTPNTNPIFNNSSLTLARPEIHHPQVNTHFVSFPLYTIIGAVPPSGQVTITASLASDQAGAVGGGVAPGNVLQGGNTSATVCVQAGPAVRLAPVPEVFPGQAGLPPTRVPTAMYIGRVAPRFCVQAVDVFGNRVTTVNGNTATISFPTTISSPFDETLTKAQSPASATFSGTGNSATAVNGVYCYTNFIPAGPVSDLLGVNMLFTDAAIGTGTVGLSTTGIFPGAGSLFRTVADSLTYFAAFKGPQPQTTTASTTFLQAPRVSVTVANPSNGARAVGVNSLELTERAITFLGDTGNGNFQAGDLVVGLPMGTATASTIPTGVIPFSLTYQRTANRSVFLTDAAPNSINLPAALPAGARVNTASGMLPAGTPHRIVNTVGQDSTYGGYLDDLSPRRSTPGASVNLADARIVNIVSPTGATSQGGSGTANIGTGKPNEVFSFRARYSDQRWDDISTVNVNERTAGLQGPRVATMRLYRDTAGTVYDLVDSVGTVTLLDPPRVAPIIANAIQDRNLQLNREETQELESVAIRSDGFTSWVFYDDNYDPMFYSVSSDDKLTVSHLPSNPAPQFGNRPTISYRTRANVTAPGSSEITVRATTADGQFAEDKFVVSFISSVTASVAVDPAEVKLAVSPNPTTDRVTVSAIAKQTGTVRINVVNTLGAVVASVEQPAFAGQQYSVTIPMNNMVTGMYSVQINDGSVTAVKQVVKN